MRNDVVLSIRFRPHEGHEAYEISVGIVTRFPFTRAQMREVVSDYAFCGGDFAKFSRVWGEEIEHPYAGVYRSLCVVEGVESTYRYHLALANRVEHKSLCGAQIMGTSVTLENWGFVGHLNERYCTACEGEWLSGRRRC